MFEVATVEQGASGSEGKAALRTGNGGRLEEGGRGREGVGMACRRRRSVW